MNPRLGLLQPYPFERLRGLLAGVTPPAGMAPISLGLGEPQHPTPALIKQAVTANLAGLSRYPATAGQPELRETIAAWIARRFALKSLDPATQVLPANGSKEALFSLVQAALDPDERDALVICPNPFYQIYEGATLLAGARPYFVNSLAGERSQARLGFDTEGRVGEDAHGDRMLAQQPARPRDDDGRVEARLRAFRQARLPHRRRRVLQRDLFRRGQAAAGGARRRAVPGP